MWKRRKRCSGKKSSESWCQEISYGIRRGSQTSEPCATWYLRAAVSWIRGEQEKQDWSVHRSRGTTCVCWGRGRRSRRQKSSTQCEVLYRLVVQYKESVLWTWSLEAPCTASKQSNGKYAQLNLSAFSAKLKSLWPACGSCWGLNLSNELPMLLWWYWFHSWCDGLFLTFALAFLVAL